jgi:hypothetical protein
MQCLEKNFDMLVKYDQKYKKYLSSFPADFPQARVYLQIQYECKCNKTDVVEQWRGRKWYLTQYMTDSEIIFTALDAFKAVIMHEAMEGFKVDNKILVNQHIDFEELLKISDKEVKRS